MENASYTQPPIRLSVHDKRCLATLGVVIIIVISSLPLLMSYIPFHLHHDLKFHLYRIDGIAEALRSGQFPVRMQTTQINGLGYPVSICYGDLFLYIPAALRLLGMSVKGSYSVFVFLVNIFTTTISYIVFKRMSSSTSISLMAAALWTWSPYRLLDDVWLRAAVGEYLALSFFPVVLYGVYSIFFYNAHGASRLSWLWCALGISGVVYSHILSVLFLIIVFAPLTVYLLFRHHDRRILFSIVKAFVATLLLCLAFAVPFLDYYRNADMRVTSQAISAKRAMAERHAIEPAQLLFFLPSVNSGSAVGATVNEMPFNVGWSALLGLFLWLGCCTIPLIKDRIGKPTIALGVFLTVLSALFAFCATCYFPWNADLGTFLNELIGIAAIIQFPWRLVSVVSFLLIIVSVIALAVIRNVFHKASYAICVLIFAVAGFEALFGLTSFMVNAEAMPSDYHEVDRSGVSNGEYLPNGAETKELLEISNHPLPAAGLDILFYSKQGTSVHLEVSSHGKDSNLTLPLLCYPHYAAYLKDGFSIPITRSKSGLISLTIPTGYQGTVDIRFEIPVTWNAAAVVTALSFLVCLVVVARSLPPFETNGESNVL